MKKAFLFLSLLSFTSVNAAGIRFEYAAGKEKALSCPCKPEFFGKEPEVKDKTLEKLMTDGKVKYFEGHEKELASLRERITEIRKNKNFEGFRVDYDFNRLLNRIDTIESALGNIVKNAEAFRFQSGSNSNQPIMDRLFHGETIEQRRKEDIERQPVVAEDLKDAYELLDADLREAFFTLRRICGPQATSWEPCISCSSISLSLHKLGASMGIRLPYLMKTPQN